MSLLPAQLRTFEYYKRKLPMYLQKSNSFQEHFKIWYDLMMGNMSTSGIVPTAEELLNLLNIFDGYYNDQGQFVNTYLQTLNSLKSSSDENSNILDKIGSIFALKRNMRISFINDSNEVQYVNLSLSDEEFLMLIKCKIIKSNCEGTREQIEEYYKSIGLTISIITSDEPATAQYYLITDESVQYSQNILYLLLSGELIIAQMGIKYIFSTIDTTRILVWSDSASAITRVNMWSGDDFEGGLWL